MAYIDTKDIYKLFKDGVANLHVSDIDALPRADAEEVRHGEWKEIRNAYGELEGWLCECGRESKIKENYCPECSAKMDGGKI